jgi:hypothetical protein
MVPLWHRIVNGLSEAVLDILGVTYPLAEPAKHLLAINAFSTVKAVNALQQLCFQFLKGLRLRSQR